MRYFYARVSTKGQNLARQLDAADGVDGVDKVFSDKQSGKSFDRPAYVEMKNTVRSGDEVVIKSLDRLGRNKTETKKELEWFREHGVLVRILDLPTTMIEFPSGQEWVMDMVNNIIIEVYAAIAEQERITIQQRRKEGIASMPTVNGKKISAKTGRGFGRPKKEIDICRFEKLLKMQKRGEMTATECCNELGVSRSLWYELAKQKAAFSGDAENTANTQTAS